MLAAAVILKELDVNHHSEVLWALRVWADYLHTGRNILVTNSNNTVMCFILKVLTFIYPVDWAGEQSM